MNGNVQNGFYKTDYETYFVNRQGVMFCVQSPDLEPDGVPRRVIEMPANAVPLTDESCMDLYIPDWVRLVQP